ncbi:Hint domain-containing protein [Litoreibacter sp.]|nr:Hint domain-containing protein [Litoreibacter sp.]
MAEFNFSVIHLGNIAELDTVDGNATAENQDALLGTYRGGGDAASGHITTLTAQDTNSDGLINSNDTGTTEAVSFDLGGGTVNTSYDAVFNVEVTVSFAPGSGEPPYVGVGGIIQTETGDLFFVMIDDDAGLGANSLDNVPIDSITVDSISSFGTQQFAAASDGQSFVACFSTGTRIRTQQGIVRVENLSIGDQVETLDNGFQKVRWVGRRRFSAPHLEAHPNLRAIYIDAGALGDECPSHDLVVSPQHRVLLRSKITQRMTDEHEILVPAIKLVGFPGIQQLTCELGIQYHHFACSSHELIWANGLLAETLYMGPQMKQALTRSARNELEAIMPRAFKAAPTGNSPPIRPIIVGNGVLKNMLARHIKNDVHLVST